MNDKYGVPFYSVADPNGRFITWVILFYNPINNINIDLVDKVLSKTFERYKFVEVNEQEQGDSYIAVVGRTKIRKRVASLAKMVDALMKRAYKNGTHNYKVLFYKSLVSFEKADFGIPVSGSSNDRDEYEGKDIRMLDDKSNRFEWQQSLLELVYDETKEEFVKPDDRTITWVVDKNGNTGKSKFVKWICVNRPDEVVKMSFGTASQLRTSLVACGPKICYFIDIPRTIGKEDNINNLITVIEDLKNGHIVSSMYGKFGTLLIDPPHIIILSNQKCPIKLMSKDRWKRYEINKRSLRLDILS